MSDLTESQALEALREAMFGEPLELDDNAITAAEMCTAWGLSQSTVRRRITQMLAEGSMERVGKRIERSNGAPIVVDAYRLVT